MSKNVFLKYLAIIIVITFSTYCFSQNNGLTSSDDVIKKDNWNFGVQLNQYSASLIIPKLSPIHPGISGLLSYNFIKKEKYQIGQDLILGTFYHKHFQTAIHCYTEFNTKIILPNKFCLSPMVFGGGYLLSILNMQSFIWNGTGYENQENTSKNNWLLSIGSNLEIPTKFHLLERKLNVVVKYRIQMQGIIIKQNVPIIAYAPISIGINLSAND